MQGMENCDRMNYDMIFKDLQVEKDEMAMGST